MAKSGSGSLNKAEIQAVRALLERIGVTPEQLASEFSASSEVPTFEEYIKRVASAVTPGTRRVYGTYWGRVNEAWGGRRLDDVTPSDVSSLAEQMKSRVVVRSNSRGGRTAAEHLIAALRCLYSHAVADGLIRDRDNPAKHVPKPRRLASTRRALSNRQLTEIYAVAGTTGNDRELDLLVLRLHIETACRRGGALALRRVDLDAEQCLVCLHEKGDTVRWQPISPTLAASLQRHHDERTNGDPRSSLLRYRTGSPITSRRYDYLWQRVASHLPWVAAQQVSAHWLRHTTLTWVERNFGYGVARAYAGHNDRSDGATTSTYVRADIYEVARALAALTGEGHPLLSDSIAGSGSANPGDHSSLGILGSPSLRLFGAP